MELQITDEIGFKLLGSVFWGDPFHSAEEWSVENEIGKLWMRFMGLVKKNSKLLQKIWIRPDVGYEIHIETEEFRKNKQYYVFVGMEVTNLEEIPVDMFAKILPKTKYVMTTTKVHEFDTVEYILKDWIRKGDYEQAYPYIIQVYDYKRFKGMEHKDSELDWYIPLRQKNK